MSLEGLELQELDLDKLSKKYGLGKELISNLADIKYDVLNKDYDAFIIVSGLEGNGKSTLAQRCCRFLSPNFSNDYIFFTREEWEKKKYKLKKGDAVDFTEGSEIAMSKEAMTTEVRTFEKEITQWRGRNLFIFMEISDFKMLTRYLRESRPLGLFWVPRRGVVWVYSFIYRNSREAAKVASLKKELMNGNFVQPSFISTFEKFDDNDKEWRIYMKRKAEHMRRDRESKIVKKLKEKIEKKLEGSVTVRELSKIYGITIYTIHKWLRRGIIPKKHVFRDPSGRVRIDKKGVLIFDKKIQKKVRWGSRTKKLNTLKKANESLCVTCQQIKEP